MQFTPLSETKVLYSNKSYGLTMRRLCVSLDDESFQMIEELQNNAKTSKADIFRMLIRFYDNQQKTFKDVDNETMMIYLDYLLSGEHVILDVDFLNTIFNELKNPSEDFWEYVRECGIDHGRQYLKKGMRTLKDILYYISKSNLFRLKVESPDYCILILINRDIKKFMRTFLVGVFEGQGKSVQITESMDKLTIQLLH
jgi:hypothetical protein